MIVAGTDEAGRGPLAGPVVSAVTILKREQAHVLIAEGLKDSKKLKPKDRERLFRRMQELSVCWRARAASPRRIDSMNILRASLWTMGEAVRALPQVPDLLIVDGTFTVDALPHIRQKALQGADNRVPSVAAASIIAKVLRDRVMTVLDRIYPGYGFAQHKGYPTQAHRLALLTLGSSPIHRKSFKSGGTGQ